MTRPRRPLLRRHGVALAVSGLAILAALALATEFEPVPFGRPRPAMVGTGLALGGLLIIWLATACQRAREAQETLHSLSRLSALGIVVLGPDARVRSWSPVAEQIFGWTEAETLGRPPPVIPLERWAEFRASVDAALRGEVLNKDMRHRTKSGEPLDGRVSTGPLRDADDRVSGVLMVVSGVTADRRAEEALHRSARELADFFDNAAVGFHWIGPDGRILRVNRTELNLLGYTREEYVGRHIAEFHVDRAVIEDILRQVARGTTLHEGEARLRCKDGSIKHVLIDANALWEGGRFVHARCVTRDITHRMQAEEALRAKNEFLATVARELRSPLNAIAGWAGVIEESHAGDAATVAQAAEAIGRNVRMQARMVQDLLDVSRIVTGRLRLEWQPVDLVRVIEAALAAIRPAAETKTLRLDATLDPTAGTVRGDPVRLQQIVGNLLANAVEFTPHGGRVEVRLERAASQVHIRVMDTGQGIAPEVLPTVFDYFRQADGTTTRRHGGLGLGLAIARHLVELHGGTVGVESPGVGQGATFTVALPIPAAPPPASALEAGDGGVETAAVSARAPGLRGMRVLVVDDDPDARTALTRLLEHCGARVWAAASATEALAALESEIPDVLVSDIAMPEEDGYTLVRKIRQRPPARGGRIPAVALTGYADAQDVERARTAGYQRHFAKPVRLADLVGALTALTGRASAGSAIADRPPVVS